MLFITYFRGRSFVSSEFDESLENIKMITQAVSECISFFDMVDSLNFLEFRVFRKHIKIISEFDQLTVGQFFPLTSNSINICNVMTRNEVYKWCSEFYHTPYRIPRSTIFKKITKDDIVILKNRLVDGYFLD